MRALLEQATTFLDDLVRLRREIHAHPELAFQEQRTAATAARIVRDLGFDVRTGIGRTGVLAELRHGAGPVIALRADMDALPIREENDVDYRSTNDGVMHACGHDAHVAMLVGAARLLADARARGQLSPGTVRLLFQPAEEASDEEGKSGAARMIDDGAMDGVAAVFGVHVGAHLPAGQVFLGPGPMMAGSDLFDAVIEGTAAHAARPHEGTDALVLAAHVVLACQNAVARRLSPTRSGVLTIGTINGGTAENIIADRVALRGTVRYFEPDVRRVLHRELERALAVAAALGGRTRLELRPGYPPLVNDEAMTALARDAIAATLGEAAIAPFEPIMGAEDFALLLQRAPGAFLWLGAALDLPREHHHPRFDIDERVLPRGAAILAACTMHALRELAG